MHPTLALTYNERSELPNLTPLATYLLRLVHVKRTNLCVSADVTTTKELLQIAEDVGDHICVLKTHADIISDFGEKTIRGLNEISRRKKFIVFEDRKFGDIGSTVQHQYVGGPLTIVRWAPIVNAHIFPGPAIITALAQAAQRAILAYNTSVSTECRASPRSSAVDTWDDPDEDDDDDNYTNGATSGDESETEYEHNGRKHSVVSVSTTISMKSEAISPQPSLRPAISRVSSGDPDDEDEGDDPEALEHLGPPPYFRSLLLLAQMSSANNYFTPEYTSACLKHARENKDFVMGFIAQQTLNQAPDDNFITMTPGVQLQSGGDGLGQQYNTPQKVVSEGGTDIIIVGRGIIAASDRRAAALEYRKQGWQAYRDRVRTARKQRR
ncbi:related to Orotidine 5'-phosphate decarboxylase [Ramularia collo-cygni]|uniref:Orotidine 5'-phosphate decarboxylase n=1 Tax=Ramularia collo-cygni TaxID=112498 RepID=A0A2D3UTL4_9PEZI|nr:related to Orotidine 5'-phosphate decarboxylase [Ramularia collo-cygni]CZT19791.1 related to Orotidine 5'-phosphate decarboxylase [Ramularia collo-cygni]